MSYESAKALQEALYLALSQADALEGVLVADTVPAGAQTDMYILLGPEEVIDASDSSGGGAIHNFVVSVISESESFLKLKEAAAAVITTLTETPLTLAEGHLVGISFVRGNARRLDDGKARRIDATFRARIEL